MWENLGMLDSAVLVARELRAEAESLCAESRRRRRRSQVLGLQLETRTLARELESIDGVLSRWDGLHPSAGDVEARVGEVELRLSRVRARLQPLRPDSG